MLSAKQSAILIGVGVALWLAAALFIRTFPMLSDGGLRSIGVFLGFIPAAWLSVRLCDWAANLDQSSRVPGVAVMLVTAALLDGIALTWFQPLYGVQPEKILLGAAGLLWGIGTVLLAALLMGRRSLSRKTLFRTPPGPLSCRQ